MTTANTRPRPINWRQEYLHIAVVLMTICWLTGWLALSLNWFLEISLANTLGVSILHLLGSALIVRWLLHRRTPINRVTAIILLLMLVAAGVTLLLTPSLARGYDNGDSLGLSDLFYIDQYERVPAGPIVTLWVFFLWWRGYQLASVYMTHTRASFGMRLGLLSFVWIALLADAVLRRDVLTLLPVFFFFGLLASSLARADSLNLDRARANRAFGRGWIPSLVLIAFLLTAGGFAFALWLSGMDITAFGEGMRVIMEGIITLLFIIFSPLLLLGQVVYDFLKSIMPDSLTQAYEASGTGGEKAANNLNVPWASDAINLLTHALMIMTIVFIILVVIAFIWFLILSIHRDDEYEDEERESLGTGEVVSNLRQALRDNWRRLAGALGILRQFGLSRDLFTALTIRRIYARTEKLAATRGYPRAAAETPYEYLRTLLQAFPANSGDTQTITEAYVAVRYGELPEDPAAMQLVRTAWQQLQHSPELPTPQEDTYHKTGGST